MWRFNPFPIHLCLATLWFARARCGVSFPKPSVKLGNQQYNWDGHYGAAVSTADWNNDGWPDLTCGRDTRGAQNVLSTKEATGLRPLALPWFMGSETKAILWLDVDNDGDDDFFVQEEHGKCGLIRNDGDTAFVDVTSTSQTCPKISQNRQGCLLGTWTTMET